MRLWFNGPLLLALSMLFWAGSIVSGRAAAALVPPSLFTLLRWGGALVIVLPLAWPHLRADRASLVRRWPVVVALAALGVVAFNNLMYRGLHDTTAINALLLQSATPLFVIVALVAMFRERPSWREVGAIAVSLAGVAMIAGQGSLEVLRSLDVNPGDTLVTAAVICYALYSALLRLKPAVHPLSLLAATFAIGVAFLVPLAWQEAAAGARLILTPVSVVRDRLFGLLSGVPGVSFLQSRRRIGGAGAGGAVCAPHAGVRGSAGGAVPGGGDASVSSGRDRADRRRVVAGTVTW